ncbi:hypothetical protein [Embleya sp. NPDC050493]
MSSLFHVGSGKPTGDRYDATPPGTVPHGVRVVRLAMGPVRAA